MNRAFVRSLCVQVLVALLAGPALAADSEEERKVDLDVFSTGAKSGKLYLVGLEDGSRTHTHMKEMGYRRAVTRAREAAAGAVGTSFVFQQKDGKDGTVTGVKVEGTAVMNEVSSGDLEGSSYLCAVVVVDRDAAMAPEDKKAFDAAKVIEVDVTYPAAGARMVAPVSDAFLAGARKTCAGKSGSFNLRAWVDSMTRPEVKKSGEVVLHWKLRFAE